MPYVGLMTRLISWAVDFLLINLVAIITGLGAELIVGIFPITKNLKPLFLAIAGGVYVLWTAGYFVAFWSATGQTPGSRLMQVRLVTANGEKVKPVRALVRYIAMNLAMVPLPWGYAPDSALLTWPMGLTAPSADAQRCAALKPRGHLLELGVDRCCRARLRPLPSWSQSTELPKSELRSRPSGPAGECGKRSSAGEPIISGASLKGALSKPT